MTATIQCHEEQPQRSWLGLGWLVIGLICCALILHRFAGPPHVPRHLPTWDTAVSILRGSYLAPEIVASVLTTTAWIVWLWIGASLTLRLLVGVADTVARGAVWVRRLRAISDRVTLPLVRRAVDAALVAVVIVNVAARAPGPAAAASRQPTVTAAAAVAPSPGGGPSSHGTLPQHEPGGTVQYTVQPGDSLWAISERFYGTGDEFPRLVAANAGRVMSDGRRFTPTGVIHPGWVLLISSPTQGAGQGADVGVNSYVVEPGDTLRSIAARFLGNEARWSVIFQLNVGTARVDGHVLTDPDLIWPGLPLRLPGPPSTAAAPPPPPVPPAPPHTQSPHEPPSPTESAVASSPVVSTPQAAVAPPAATPSTTEVRTKPTPAAAAAPHPEIISGHEDSQPSPLTYGAVGLTAAALAGGATLLIHRRLRRSLDEPPVSPLVGRKATPSDEFAEAESVRLLMDRLADGEVEPAVFLANDAQHLIDDAGLDEATVILAYQGRKVVTLLISANTASGERLVNLAASFGDRMGANLRAAITVEGDVVWQIPRITTASLPISSAADDEVALPLVAMGVVPSQETVYANWSALGHVLIAGLPGGGADVVLTSLVAELAARCRPDTLRLVVIGCRRTLPRQLAEFPHVGGEPVDSDDDAGVRRILGEVRAELLRRMRVSHSNSESSSEPVLERPELVLVTDRLDALDDHGTTVEMIATHGPAHGIRLLAATTESETLGEDVLPHFTTRLVLQVVDDESVRLLGRPDAADLGRGEFFLWIDGREPIRLRGFRVSDAHLDELIRLARDAQCGGSPAAPWVVADSADPEIAVSRTDCSEALAAELLKETAAGALGDPAVLELGAADLVVSAAGGPAAQADGPPETDAVPVDTSPSPEIAWVEPSAEDAAEIGRDEGVQEAGPPLQIRCLGEFSVRSGDREIQPVGEDGRSYKSWEVLAFLAAQPGLATSKDKLLAAVWPDIDEQRAGNRMRVAMARLRALLIQQIPEVTPDAVSCERDGTCRLDPTLIWSDAAEFLSLCRDAAKLPPEQAKSALERARSLFNGDLLTGRGTRSYDWLDERDDTGPSPRERYREEYYRATQRLARLYSREGHPERAVPLYKDILRSEPTLEDIVRELYRCYQQLGDLSSLVREERHLRQQLREAYADPNDSDDDPEQYQPEPETVELFNRVREELESQALAGASRGRKR